MPLPCQCKFVQPSLLFTQNVYVYYVPSLLQFMQITMPLPRQCRFVQRSLPVTQNVYVYYVPSLLQFMQITMPVSYTHLTLPTKLSV